MTAKPRHPYLRFSPRRKALLALVAIALALVVWLQYRGAAGISGISTDDMDWNSDGDVTQQEILQAFYAVSVTTTREGQRECKAFRWRKQGQGIRVDCRTEIAEAAVRE